MQVDERSVGGCGALKLYFETKRNVLPHAGEISLKGMEQVIALMAEGGILQQSRANDCRPDS